MARKPFMEMDLEEFEDNDIVGDIDEPSLDFDFDDDTEETTPDEDTSDIDTADITDSSEPTSRESSRAQFKDKAYFDEYITKQRERIKKISSEPNSSSESGERMLGNMYMDLISADYSDGMTKEEMYTDVNDMFSHIKTVDSYAAMVDYLSIAILFNINGDKINSILSNNQYDDNLVSKLKDVLGSTASGEGVKYESYKIFDDVLNDKISSEEFLNYVNNNWYEDSEDRCWYDSHNSSENTYTGYWCWVGAAVAQIKDIDTRGSKYIPSELISSTTQEGYTMEAYSFGKNLAAEWIKKPEVIKEINDGIDKQFSSLFPSGIKPSEADLADNRKKILAKNVEPHILMSMYAKKSFDAMLKEEQRLEEEKMRKDMDAMIAKIMGKRNGDVKQEAFVQEGMFDAGFNNLRSKIAQALGEKFKVTNVVKGMGGKDKFDITEQDVEDPTKTTVESTGTACNVTVRGDGKIGRKIGITLSSALDKILEIVKKPDLVLESGFYNISRNVNGGFYQEADDETADDEDFDIDAELKDLDSDDDGEENTSETKDEEESSDDDNNDNKDVEEVDIDIESFGSDTSDVQNEYDQKDVDALNKLIAAESEAINDYFDASKDTRNEDLRTLFSDIGHEERFHLEQLMYSKSILTGEKYEPRDPEVKKEYEELISNGVDEDEALSTAVEKHRIDGGNIDLDEVEQEAAYIYDTLRNSEILTEYCCKAIEQKRVKNALISAETKFVVEAFIQESLENVSQASKKDIKIKSPIDILMKGLALSVKGIIKMGEVTRDALHKNNLKNARRKEWIKKHGIVELFRSGVALYFWNDKNNVYDINLACRYVDMLYRLSKDIGAKCGVRLTQDAQRKPIQNPLKYSNIEDGINILKGVVLSKTKIVVNEHNKDIIANTFFGYTPDKVGVAVTHGKDGKPVNDSANIYNRVDVALVLTKDYSEVSNAVLGALKRLEGDTNSVFYKNRALFDKSVSQMEFVVKKYQEFVSCLAHDLKVMTKLDNGMLQETRNRDEAEQNGGKK